MLWQVVAGVRGAIRLLLPPHNHCSIIPAQAATDKFPDSLY
jgi:hypothetical protein